MPAIRPCSQAMKTPQTPVSISRPSTISATAPTIWIVRECRRRTASAPAAQPNPKASATDWGGSAWRGLSLVLFYCAGLGLPFIAMAFGFG